MGTTFSAKGGDQPLRGKRVLVVEDRSLIATLLADMLGLHGHTVDTVANGAMALRQLQERTYDLIVSDLQMPVLDGRGLYQELKRSRPDLVKRIVFVTGNAEDPVWRRFLSDTGAPCVSKPFTIETIHRVTQHLLRGAGSAREARLPWRDIHSSPAGKSQNRADR